VFRFAGFNRLLEVMETSLAELRKALQGLVVMSSHLEVMYTCMLNNQVSMRVVERGTCGVIQGTLGLIRRTLGGIVETFGAI
jgi:hypothetical protein